MQKAYDKAWLDAILYTLNKNGIEGKNLEIIRKLNSNLSAKIRTRHGLTREIKIKDSIRQGGVLSVIEYATLIDEISKELKAKGLGIETEAGEILDSLLWMDDVCLIHYDLDKLQKILDIANHVAKKYHIVFGAAKCKVIKIGKGPASNLKLDGEILEETNSYKYLGEIFNNKGNLEDHIKGLEGKIHAATQNIIAETGNKEFKGMKMQAIWQMAEAVLIPIITYGAEGWDLSTKEKDKIQTIFNKAIKTLLFMPTSTPTTILLEETGFLTIEQLTDRQKVMQAQRVEGKSQNSLIKKLTRNSTSLWKSQTSKIMSKLKISEEDLNLSKPMLKKKNRYSQ